MKLLTKVLRDKLISNHVKHKQAWNDEHPTSEDFKVVVKLFNPTGIGTWWLSELDPETNNAFGVAELHEREMGYVNLTELEEFRGRFGLGIERDLYFSANKHTLEDIMNKDKFGRQS